MTVDIRIGKKYAVIVSTDKYTGNFERELTAYCTGRVGECDVGDELVPLYMKDFALGEQDVPEDPFWDSLDWVSDDRGCPRPCSIYPSRKNDGTEPYNSVIMFFQEKPSAKQVKIIKERAKQYSDDPRIARVSRYSAYQFTVEDVYVIEIKTAIKRVR